MCKCLPLGVVDHVDPCTVIPPDVNPEAVTKIRHGDGICVVVVTSEGELVSVHFAAPVWLVDVVIVVRNQTQVKHYLNYFVVLIRRFSLVPHTTSTQHYPPASS